jgi:choline dehydrogenase-like flavoprotein
MLGDEHPSTLFEGNFHHLGTTRMHPDPNGGVVDADCRVHGIRNLYVAGSSVFPAYGCSNPTLTLVALALRLADHLQRSWRTHGRRKAPNNSLGSARTAPSGGCCAAIRYVNNASHTSTVDAGNGLTIETETRRYVYK